MRTCSVGGFLTHKLHVVLDIASERVNLRAYMSGKEWGKSSRTREPHANVHDHRPECFPAFLVAEIELADDWVFKVVLRVASSFAVRCSAFGLNNLTNH